MEKQKIPPPGEGEIALEFPCGTLHVELKPIKALALYQHGTKEVILEEFVYKCKLYTGELPLTGFTPFSFAPTGKALEKFNTPKSLMYQSGDRDVLLIGNVRGHWEKLAGTYPSLFSIRPKDTET